MRALLARVVALAMVAICVAGGASARAAATVPKALKQLQATLSTDLQLPGGSLSALVKDETTGQTLFAVSPNVGRLPASVEKLYTTSTALMEFGPTARLQTSVLGVGTLKAGGVWKGSLYLRGGGDPTFGDASFDSIAYGTGATVQALAAAVRRAGITRITGPIIGDESYFDSLRGTVATGYQANLVLEGQLSALAYDAGFLTAEEDSLQPRPALYATQQFAAALTQVGIDVPASTHLFTGRTPAGARLIATVSSPTMANLIQLTNTPSDSFFAETLMKDIGARFGTAGTTAAGVAVARSVLARHFDLYPRFDDGSGLSRYDRTTPTQIVSLLQQQENNKPFTASLAIAGISGTWKDGMLGTLGVDNCHGKTGTLHDVANLVGYCTDRNDHLIIFAFMLNSLDYDSTYAHTMEFAAGAALAGYKASGSTTTPTTTTPTTTTPTTTTPTTTTPTTSTPTTTTTTTTTPTPTTTIPTSTTPGGGAGVGP